MRLVSGSAVIAGVIGFRQRFSSARLSGHLLAAVVFFVLPLVQTVTVRAQSNRSSIDSDRMNESVSFIESYCIECHLPEDPGGDREFESLDLSQNDLDTQVLVQDMVDQLTLGTMPPDDVVQPSVDERLAAINQLTAQLSEMRESQQSTGGRSVLRRLSRREYLNTISDLLFIDTTMFDPTEQFPSDQLFHNFDNIGESLVTSADLLEKYFDAADLAVEKAFAIEAPVEPQTWLFKDGFYQQPELRLAHKKAFNFRYLCLYDHPANDKPEGAYGFAADFTDGVPHDGRYRVRVLAQALNRDCPYDSRTIKIDLDEPFRMGIRPGDTSIGDLYRSQPTQPLLAEKEITSSDPTWYTFEVPLDRGFVPRFTFENGMADVRASFGRVFRYHRDTLPKSVQKQTGISKQRVAVVEHGYLPHIRIHEVEVHGPIDTPWPTDARAKYFGQAVFSTHDARAVIKKFADRAYRRPASASEIQRLESFFNRRRKSGRPAYAAIKDTFKAALCSPGFLYFKTTDAGDAKSGERDVGASIDGSADSSSSSRLPGNGIGRLDEPANLMNAYELAERLSYFLTASMPDDLLRSAADDASLLDQDALVQQAGRLLSDERSSEFVIRFLDSWLNLRSLGSMPPDAKANGFYFAAGLDVDMKQESFLFFQDLIGRNGSLLDFLAADYSFINRDLAKLYGVTGQVQPKGAADFRRVQFTNSHRGGLLGQGSVLTVTANGIETSPVVRGVWILENILGTPTPPPPDDVPAIEPDIRGAKTVRDQIRKHRDTAACMQCHRHIDPIGFALECFDPIGKYRSYYEKDRKKPVDTSGELPGGRTFSDVAGLKEILLERSDFFARAFTEKLLTYATGRRMEDSDRAAIDAILASVRNDRYPARSLIESVVRSELFRRR